MKYLVTWKFYPGKLAEALAAFSNMTPEQEAADHGAEITMIGRWHNLAAGSGVAVVESSSATALANWALNWNHILDLDISPVLDDAECRAVGQARSAG